MFSLGMTSYDITVHHHKEPASQLLYVLLDGRIVGTATAKMAAKIASQLRILKAKGLENVPAILEIGYVPPIKDGQFPGLYLFTTPARMMRPVRNLATNTTEMIGSFEQVYMDIAVDPSEVHQGVSYHGNTLVASTDPCCVSLLLQMTTHVELDRTSILSAVASLTPFSDHNQSPRNMYQCQVWGGVDYEGGGGGALHTQFYFTCRADGQANDGVSLSMYPLQNG